MADKSTKNEKASQELSVEDHIKVIQSAQSDAGEAVQDAETIMRELSHVDRLRQQPLNTLRKR